MYQKLRFVVGILLMSGVLFSSLYGIGQSMASGSSKYRQNPALMSGVQYELYKEECGSCHIAYPPRLLPEQSWQKMMQQLDDHFGENAELDNETSINIDRYLAEASRPIKGSYRKVMRNSGQMAPLRISELPYFRHEHDEIPSRFIAGNDKVASLSQCDACHKHAEQGDFDEDNIHIPGFGRWDD